MSAGASLKFTLLNRQGRVWTLIAGGGASVVPWLMWKQPVSVLPTQPTHG